MPTKRTRTRRKPQPEIAPEMLAWLAGTGPMPVEAYFFMAGEEAELRKIHQRAIAAEIARHKQPEQSK